ncbi:hypothetical protein SAMN06298216_1390 [Spirosomataceae bacterium TFI 002]|nr:hypothetical protein SAMN06298216_1390 [Spirosomataceae bacterium TFI 002]
MSQKAVFTICSINYLAQARVLGESLLKFNPEYSFFIGLCDKIEGSGVDKSKLPDFPIIEAHTIGIENFDWMQENYDITEFNTAIKPFFLQYFLDQNPEIEFLYYIDPDIQFFDKLTVVEDGLANHDIVLTPHFYTPVYDDFKMREQEMFVNGIYNLGFLAVKRSKTVDEFVKWWQTKLATECFMDISKGMFVDQLYCNMVPLYWDSVKIEKYPGLNIAYWNLHERTVSEKEGKFYVNGVPLVFFHYSGIDVNNREGISRWQTRFDFIKRPDLKPVFDQYRDLLISYDNDYFRGIRCYYHKPEPVPPKKSFIKRALTSSTFRFYRLMESLPI